ncbi:MAG: M56 family metallopeptidase [Ginsengibacter sp.]
MIFFFIYFIKLSVSLGVVYLFYYFILRKLTYYNHNRWYLLGYTLLSFIIPFINIAEVLEKNDLNSNNIIAWVPVINTTTVTVLPTSEINSINGWNVAMMIIVAGMVIMAVRLLIQLISFRRMLKKATPVTEKGIHIYQLDENIIPFSFVNSIFINRHLHSEKELQEIIHHEFIHVKQRHSIDIIWGEVLCLLNWFNPFAWLLKKAIRQNLEFIADNKVLENGVSKTAYQYLLLKVTGNNQYSIATQFNFSSLKKRIAMMNKLKSTKRQLLRMLFLLPATAILLLAFRSKMRTGEMGRSFNSNVRNLSPKDVVDTPPPTPTQKRSPTPPIPLVEAIPAVPQIEAIPANAPPSPAVPTLNKEKPPVPPLPPAPPAHANVNDNSNINDVSDNYEITDKKAVIYLRNGKTEEYNFTNANEKRNFESRYGKGRTLTSVNAPREYAAVTNAPEMEVAPEVKLTTSANTYTNFTSGTTTAPLAKTITSAKKITTAPVINSLAPNNNGGTIMNGKFLKEDILITITKTTKPAELDEFVKQMKEKGYELKFNNKNYNGGILTHISGTLKYKGSSSTFSVTDFNKLLLGVVIEDGKVYFDVRTDDEKVRI